MTDDVIDTAGTLIAGAAALKEAGAMKVYACATHGLFNGPALERIASSAIDRLVVTDTVPVDPPTQARERRGAVGRRDPRRDDQQRLRRRLGLGDLRGREPALLAATAVLRSSSAVPRRRSHPSLQSAAVSGDRFRLEVQERDVRGSRRVRRLRAQGPHPRRSLRRRVLARDRRSRARRCARR